MTVSQEAEYRQKIESIFNQIEKALSDVDPDQIECEQAMGALTLTFSDQTRCILSAQPSVRQLWLALASKGTAYHFNYDDASKSWLDDKGRGVELVAFLEGLLKEMTGEEIHLFQKRSESNL